MIHKDLFSAQLSPLISRLQLPSGNLQKNVFLTDYTRLFEAKPPSSLLFCVLHFSEWYHISPSSKHRNLRDIFDFSFYLIDHGVLLTVPPRPSLLNSLSPGPCLSFWLSLIHSLNAASMIFLILKYGHDTFLF